MTFPDTTALFSLLLMASALAAALHALLRKRDSKSAFGWVALSLVLPAIGPLIYLVFGINRLHDRANKTFIKSLELDDSPTIPEPEGTDFRPLSLIGENVSGLGLRSCDSIRILKDGENFYPTVSNAIANASTKVYVSTYIFDNDETGDHFVKLLSDAHNRGVDVRILVDGLGEFMSFPRIGRKLANLPFSRFNPITLIPPTLRINMRNHRKIIVVDGKLAFSGGQNIGDRHLVEKPEKSKRVTDLHFSFTGKIVDELERAFLQDWYICQGHRQSIPFQPSNKNRDHSEIWTRLVLDGPNEFVDRLNDLLVGIISAARTRVWIMTPYFLPGADIVASLIAARLRGVDVKILLPEKGNIILVNWATWKTLPYYLEKRMEIYLQPPPFIHTKALIIDDFYSLVGSANLDARSLQLNFELGIEVFNKQFNQDLTEYFLTKISSSTLLDETRLQKLRIPARVRNALAWLFTPYL